MAKVLLACLICLTFISCYESSDGCLDENATNYDFYADNACEDCCNFPTITIRIEPFWGNEFLYIDSVYIIEGDSIRFLEFGFLAHDFKFKNDLNLIEISGESTVTDQNDLEISYKDDISYVNTNQYNYNIGETQQNGYIDTLSFTIGLDPDLDQVLPESFPSNHTLAESGDSLYCTANSKYSRYNISIEHRNELIDTLYYKLKTDQEIIVLLTDIDTTYAIGTNIFIELGIDYESLLETTELVDTDETELTNVILDKISQIFFVQ